MDLVYTLGEENIKKRISGFNCNSLNPDIEQFLKNNAIQFSKEKKSVTYLIIDDKTFALTGYYAITHKSLSIPATGFSKTMLKRIEKFGVHDQSTNRYNIAAYLIAQFGKNYAIPREERISGNDLLELTIKNLRKIQYQLGGGIVYLDCEPNAKLMDFYERNGFRLFGERRASNGVNYMQYIKFL